MDRLPNGRGLIAVVFRYDSPFPFRFEGQRRLSLPTLYTPNTNDVMLMN